jgi:DNA-binding ferritin-like protein
MIEILLELLMQLRVLHWQTSSYVYHTAFGELYESLDSSIDKLVETHLGIIDGVYVISDTDLVIEDIKKINVSDFLNTFISTLNDIKEKQPMHTNIVDSMIDDINKTKYLLKLEPLLNY